ncbi:E3 ubiquitin-protein ligase rnf168-like [Argonauta hians]
MCNKQLWLMENYTCPICINLLIEPVTLPCKHELCLPCFQQNFEESLCCPMCRTRISSWVRKHSKINKLVNEKRWKEIKSLFPEKVRLRQEGFEEEDSEIELIFQPPNQRLAQPGEIREEYEIAVKKLNEEREIQKRKEEEASLALLKSLQEEEERLRKDQQRLESQLKKDEELARLLESLGTPALHRRNENGLNREASVTDSADESEAVDNVVTAGHSVIVEKYSGHSRTSSGGHSQQAAESSGGGGGSGSLLVEDPLDNSLDTTEFSDGPSRPADTTTSLNVRGRTPNTQSLLTTPSPKQHNSVNSKDSERRILFEKKMNVNKKSVGRSRASSVPSKLKPGVKCDPKSERLDLYFSKREANHPNSNSNSHNNSHNHHHHHHHSDKYFDDTINISEEQDRLYALALQKQYDLEVKLSETVNRSKGSIDEYKLRAKNSGAMTTTTTHNSNKKRLRDSSSESVSKKAKT